MAPRINIPPITRALLLSFIALSILNAAARYRSWSPDRSASPTSRIYYAPYLTIVPGHSIYYPWVLLTATFAEQNIAGLLITGATLFYGGRYLERAWSSREYTKFIILITLIPNVSSWLLYLTFYALTGHEGSISTAISGGIAIQAAFIVAFKQLVPEHTVTIAKPLISMRVKHFPALFLAANTLSGFLLGTDTAALLAWIGFFTSWTYLRFYRVSPALASADTSSSSSSSASATLRGDASDTFAFAYFFPDIIQPPVAALADTVYNALVAIHLCKPFSSSDIDAGNTEATARGAGELPSILNPMGSNRGSGGGGGGGASRREEAERRRALALRALDQRLSAATVKPPSSLVVQTEGPSPLGETTYEPEPEPASSRVGA